MRSSRILHKESNFKDASSFMRRWLGTNLDVINDSFIYEQALNSSGRMLIKNRSQKTNTTILKTSFSDSMVIYNEEIREDIY